MKSRATKNALISLMIRAKIDEGMTPTDALRAVFGDAVVDKMVSDLYDALRAQSGRVA